MWSNAFEMTQCWIAPTFFPPLNIPSCLDIKVFFFKEKEAKQFLVIYCCRVAYR